MHSDNKKMHSDKYEMNSNNCEMHYENYEKLSDIAETDPYISTVSSEIID